MTPSEQLELTATQALRALNDGSLTAEAYVRTLLARAEQLSHLNSMIAINANGAIAAAQRIDTLRASGAPLPSLAGLPIVVKDNINTADMPTTGGTPALRDVRPTRNAPVLQRLLDAGAIVLGKANMHELAFGTTNTNFAPFAGAARNPHDPTRVAGGSSGGTGAAVAARIAPAGLGTDTGGSVRIPAAFCGLAGLRPSVGNSRADRRYEGSGVLPISHTRDTIGPMMRTMQDVALLDAVITGTSLVHAVPISGVRLGVPKMFWADLEDRVAAVMEDALSALRAAGVVLIDVDADELMDLTHKGAFAIAVHEAHQDIPNYLAATGVTDITLEDIAAQVASPDVKPIVADVVKDGIAHEYELAMTRYRPRMQSIYARCFAGHGLDALIFPTVPVTAPVIDTVNGSPKISVSGGPPTDFFPVAIRNTDPGSTAGLPGITVPVGVASSGLPVGLALDGPIGSDRKLLGLGIALESLDLYGAPHEIAAGPWTL